MYVYTFLSFPDIYEKFPDFSRFSTLEIKFYVISRFSRISSCVTTLLIIVLFFKNYSIFLLEIESACDRLK